PGNLFFPVRLNEIDRHQTKEKTLLLLSMLSINFRRHLRREIIQTKGTLAGVHFLAGKPFQIRVVQLVSKNREAGVEHLHFHHLLIKDGRNFSLFLGVLYQHLIPYRKLHLYLIFYSAKVNHADEPAILEAVKCRYKFQQMLINSKFSPKNPKETIKYIKHFRD